MDIAIHFVNTLHGLHTQLRVEVARGPNTKDVLAHTSQAIHGFHPDMQVNASRLPTALGHLGAARLKPTRIMMNQGADHEPVSAVKHERLQQAFLRKIYHLASHSGVTSWTWSYQEVARGLHTSARNTHGVTGAGITAKYC